MNLTRKNSKRAFQVTNDLTHERQSRVNAVQDEQGKVSLKSKRLLVDGQNTVQNSATI